MDQVQGELSQARTENQDLQQNLAAQKTETTQLITRLEAFQALTETDEASLRRLEGQLDQARTELRRARSDNRALQKEVADSEAGMRTFRNEVNRLEAMAAALKSEGQKDEAQIKELQTSLTNLKTELDAVQDEKERVKAAMAGMKKTYDSLVRDLKNQIENQEVTIEQFKEKLTVNLVDRILFRSGRSYITREGRETLSKLGEILKTVEDKRIRIIGHTDDLPLREKLRVVYPTNWELSSARAVAVTRYFIDRCGLDPRKLEPTGRSYYDPVASNDTEEGQARNRRVEIVISPLLDE